MNNITKIFNELIQHKLSSQFGEVLIDCKLIGREYGLGNYGYDLLFIFEKEYNNAGIQFESVLKTCDELFNWIDLRDLPNLSIFVINKFGRHQHYSYFELMNEVFRNYGYYQVYGKTNHPKYHEYMMWKSNKEREERVKRSLDNAMERITRNDLIQQTRMKESRKKKFLFW